MAYETLLVEQRGAVTLITLNRPQALNALNVQVLSDLIEAFVAYDKDDSQRCAVITGSEKAFAAGADINEMARSEEHTSEFQSLMRSSYAVFCLKKKRSTRSEEPTSKIKYIMLILS